MKHPIYLCNRKLKVGIFALTRPTEKNLPTPKNIRKNPSKLFFNTNSLVKRNNHLTSQADQSNEIAESFVFLTLVLLPLPTICDVINLMFIEME